MFLGVDKGCIGNGWVNVASLRRFFSVAFPKFPVDYFRNTARRYVYQRRTQNRVKHLRWNFTKIVIRRNLFQKFNMELFAQIVSG